MEEILKAFLVLAILVFVVWTIFVGAGNMLILLLIAGYVFVMKHGR